MREKRRLFEIYVTNRNGRNREKYKQMDQEVKRVTTNKKDEVDVNMKRKERDQMSKQVRDSDGNIVADASEVKQRWKEYFEWLWNVGHGRRAELTERGLGVMHEFGNGELEISVEDVRKAVKKLKGGKSQGVDGITSEMLKRGGECLLEWLRRVCNVCILEEKEPSDWIRAIIVPIYKCKGDKSKCKNYRRMFYEYT